jgi:hypothetical protein
MTVLLTLVGISLAVWILWLADKWGLGEGGELLFQGVRRGRCGMAGL